MASGDHIRTAVHVSHECGILDPGRPVAVLSTAVTKTSNAAATALECVLLDGCSTATAGDAQEPSSGHPGLDKGSDGRGSGENGTCSSSGIVGGDSGRTIAVHDAMRSVAQGSFQCAVTGPALRALHQAAATARAAALAAGAGDARARPRGAAYGGGSDVETRPVAGCGGPDGPDAHVHVAEGAEGSGKLQGSWLEVVLTS